MRARLRGRSNVFVDTSKLMSYVEFNQQIVHHPCKSECVRREGKEIQNKIYRNRTIHVYGIVTCPTSGTFSNFLMLIRENTC